MILVGFRCAKWMCSQMTRICTDASLREAEIFPRRGTEAQRKYNNTLSLIK